MARPDQSLQSAEVSPLRIRTDLSEPIQTPKGSIPTDATVAYLKVGLAAVLEFVGAKMVLADVYEVPIGLSLLVIASLIGASILASSRGRGPGVGQGGGHEIRSRRRLSPMAYYFAYGDRMNSESMTNAVPAAQLVGPGRLDGYRLAFNVYSGAWGGGGANAVPDRTAALWGVLWEIPDEDMAVLEPVNRLEDGSDPELEVEVVGPDGPVQARTFAVASHEAFMRPTDRYADLLRAVAAGHGLPDEALTAIDTARLGPSSPAPRI